MKSLLEYLQIMNKNGPQLPSEYIPFDELVICSNKFINGKIPIKIKNEMPLLVGKGDIPLIWLSAPVTKDGKNWDLIVEKNKAKINKISVIPSAEDRTTKISLSGISIIQVIKTSETKAEIIELDLRPLGLNFHGDRQGFYIGTNLLSNNEFNNVPTMINID